ncbi:MAG: flavodoxin [Fusobacteriaceae bacterium]
MNKVGIFYGTTTGKTAGIVEEIEFFLGDIEFDVRNVADGIDGLDKYENLILVTPSDGVGELPPMWQDVMEKLAGLNLSGKIVGIVGLGNQLAFGESFVGGMRYLYDAVIKCGAKVVGFTSSEGYKHQESNAEIDGQFVGLALDESNDDDETPERIKNWLNIIREEFK